MTVACPPLDKTVLSNLPLSPPVAYTLHMNAIQSAVFASFAPGTVEAGEPIVSDPDDNGVRTITYPFTLKPTGGELPLDFSITATDPV